MKRMPEASVPLPGLKSPGGVQGRSCDRAPPPAPVVPSFPVSSPVVRHTATPPRFSPAAFRG